MMTTNDKTIELAKLDGWLDVKEYTYKYNYMGETGELKQLQGRSEANLGHLVGLPKYLTSYDAIMPLIRKQSEKIRMEIVINFYEIKWGVRPENDSLIGILGQANLMFNSTAEQLSDALLKATGRWVE